jgi:hypothetical protein
MPDERTPYVPEVGEYLLRAASAIRAVHRVAGRGSRALDPTWSLEVAIYEYADLPVGRPGAAARRQAPEAPRSCCEGSTMPGWRGSRPCSMPRSLPATSVNNLLVYGFPMPDDLRDPGLSEADGGSSDE